MSTSHHAHRHGTNRFDDIFTDSYNENIMSQPISVHSRRSPRLTTNPTALTMNSQNSMLSPLTALPPKIGFLDEEWTRDSELESLTAAPSNSNNKLGQGHSSSPNGVRKRELQTETPPPPSTGFTFTHPSNIMQLPETKCFKPHMNMQTQHVILDGNLSYLHGVPVNSMDQSQQSSQLRRDLFMLEDKNRKLTHEIDPNRMLPHIANRLDVNQKMISYVEDQSYRLNADMSCTLGERSTMIRGVRKDKQQATRILRNWFLDHINHPYPSRPEREWLLEKTCLTRLQLRNWFTNSRKRCLKPILEGKVPKTQFEIGILSRLQRSGRANP